MRSLLRSSAHSACLLLAASAVAAPGCGHRAYVRAPVPVLSTGGMVAAQPAYAQAAYAQPAYVRPTAAQPAYAQPAYPGQLQVQGQVSASGPYATQVQGQLLYVPLEAAQLPLQLLSSIVVQSSDGRQFQITLDDIVQGLGGRIALRIPAGVTTGTATIFLTTGQTVSTSFHIAATTTGLSLGVGPVGDPRCGWPAGTWQGSISTERGSTSTVWLETQSDCRTVRGYVHLQSADGGSVDSTIEGVWDPATSTLVARDMQLFNARPGPGGSFCATDQYQLQMSADGQQMTGWNIVQDTPCQSQSQVWLTRAR